MDTEIALLATDWTLPKRSFGLRAISQFRSASDKEGRAKRLPTCGRDHREVTTGGFQGADSEIVEIMVSLKEETEKLREQVQNLE